MEKEETAPSFQLLYNPKGGGTQGATGEEVPAWG